MTVRESVWITLDDDLLKAIDALARAKNVTRHDAARILLRLGVELMHRRPAQQLALGGVDAPPKGAR